MRRTIRWSRADRRRRRLVEAISVPALASVPPDHDARRARGRKHRHRHLDGHDPARCERASMCTRRAGPRRPHDRAHRSRGLYDTATAEATFKITLGRPRPTTRSSRSPDPTARPARATPAATSEQVILNDPKAGHLHGRRLPLPAATPAGLHGQAHDQDHRAGAARGRPAGRRRAGPRLHGHRPGRPAARRVRAGHRDRRRRQHLHLRADRLLQRLRLRAGLDRRRRPVPPDRRGAARPAGLGRRRRLRPGLRRRAQRAGQFQYAYSGLGPLTGFTTSTSPDIGHTHPHRRPAGQRHHRQGRPRRPPVDGVPRRQHGAALLQPAAAAQHRRAAVHNGGLTYNDVARPRRQGVIASNSPNFPGPMRSMPAKLVAPGATTGASPTSAGTSYARTAGLRLVNFAISDPHGGWRGGTAWCAVPTRDGGLGAFTVADNDRDGNIYLTYDDKKDFHSYLTTLPPTRWPTATDADDLDGGPDRPETNPGWSTPVQVDRGAVRTTVFPWLAAGGAPGRVAVAFYGTESDGDPTPAPSRRPGTSTSTSRSTRWTPTADQPGQGDHPSVPLRLDLPARPRLRPRGAARATARWPTSSRSATARRPKKLWSSTTRARRSPTRPTGHIATPAVVTQNGRPEQRRRHGQPAAARSCATTRPTRRATRSADYSR